MEELLAQSNDPRREGEDEEAAALQEQESPEGRTGGGDTEEWRLREWTHVHAERKAVEEEGKDGRERYTVVM